MYGDKIVKYSKKNERRFGYTTDKRFRMSHFELKNRKNRNFLFEKLSKISKCLKMSKDLSNL